MSIVSSIHLHQEDIPVNQSIDTCNELLSAFFKASSGDKENNPSVSFIVNGNPMNIISFLENKEVNLNEKTNLLKVFKSKLEGNRMLKSFFEEIEGQSIYQHLSRIYLNDENEEIKNLILELIDLFISDVSLDKIVFQMIYSRLSEYYRKEKVVSKEILCSYEILLSHLYPRNVNKSIIPKSYFSFCSNKDTKIYYDETVFELPTILSFVISFKIYQDETIQRDKDCNIFKLEFTNKQYPPFCIYLNKDGTLSLNPYNKKTITVPLNEYFTLFIIFDPEKNLVHIFTNNDDEAVEYPIEGKKENFLTNPSTQVSSITFLENFIGESTSIVCFKKNLLKKKWKNLIRGFNLMKEGLWKKEQLNDLLLAFETGAIKEGEHFKSLATFTCLQEICNFFIIPLKNNLYKNKINDIFNIYELRLTDRVKLNSHKKYYKNICVFGGCLPLIPLLEMIFLNFLSEPEILEHYFEIVYNIIHEKIKNLDLLIKENFFELIGLFLQNISCKSISNKVITLLYDIYSEIKELVHNDKSKEVKGGNIVNLNRERYKGIYTEHILFNEKILARVPFSAHIHFWSLIDNPEKLSKVLSVKTIIFLLTLYDAQNEYCCENHLSDLKDEFKPNLKDKIFQLNSILKKLEQVLINIFQNKTYETILDRFKELVRCLNQKHSPCTIETIINVFTSVILKSSIENKTRVMYIDLLLDSGFDISALNILFHSLLDIRTTIISFIIEIQKIIYLYGNPVLQKKITYFLSSLRSCFIPEQNLYFQNPNLNPSDEEINKIAQHCVSKIKKYTTDDSCAYSDQILIIKEESVNQYYQFLFQSLFFDFFGYYPEHISVNQKRDVSFESLVNLLYFISKIPDEEKTKKVIDNLADFLNQTNNQPHSLSLLKNKKILNCLLDLIYNYYLSKDNYCEKSISILEKIVKNAVTYSSNNLKDEQNANIVSNFETILDWGDKILNGEKDKQKVYTFMTIILKRIQDIFSQLITSKNLVSFKEINEQTTFHKFNYLSYINLIFQYYAYYKVDSEIILNGLDFYESIVQPSEGFIFPSIILNGMKFNNDPDKKNISYTWYDFELFNEFYQKINHIWNDENLFREYAKNGIEGKFVFSKFHSRIEQYVNDFVYSKQFNNSFEKELYFLVHTFNHEQKLDLLKVLSNTFPMIIITINTIIREESDVKYWLKEYGNFLMFLVIASTNLGLNVENYQKIQEKCIDSIVYGITFLKEYYIISESIKEEITILIHKVLILSLEIVSYSQTSSATVPLFNKRTPLWDSAIFKIFQHYFVNENGESLLTWKIVDFMKSHDKEDTIELIIKSEDMNKYFFKNPRFKKRIEKRLSLWPGYKEIVEKRYSRLSTLTIGIDYSFKDKFIINLKEYKKQILNSNYKFKDIEKEIKLKLKKVKKKELYFNGMWSDKELFYGKKQHELKYKILNHLSDDYSNPLITPILDIKYYFPNKTATLHPHKLISEEEEEKIDNNVFRYNFDIDNLLGNRVRNSIDNKSNNELIPKELSIYEQIYQKSKELYIPKFEEISHTILKTLYEKNEPTQDDSTKKTFNCCLIKQTHHIKGTFTISTNELIFVRNDNDDNTQVEGQEKKDKNEEICHGSFIPNCPKDKDVISITIPYSSIYFFLRRYYYYSQDSIEFYVSNNKSYYFKFDNQKIREEIMLRITSEHQDLFNPILDDLKSDSSKKELFFSPIPNTNFDANIGSVIGYFSFGWNKTHNYELSKSNKRLKLNKIIKKWTNYEMSNFKLLMILNILSNRSYRDLTQYPIFPWIFKVYPNGGLDTSKVENYRDLSSPMGMLELSPQGITRKKGFLDQYKLSEELGPNPYFYGTNYSNPIYTCNFLIRLFPFSLVAMQLHGGSIDISDRLFSTVSGTFVNATTTKTDVRELIPEFFYFPDMFQNCNNLVFQPTSTGKKIDEVVTPCGSDHFDFIVRMKKGLEGEYVNKNIWNWIDLIFGYKQKGKEALKIKNIYTSSSYIENINYETEQDKTSLMTSIEFGLIPIQLFSKELNSKLIKKSKSHHPFMFTSSSTSVNTDYHVYDCSSTIESKSNVLSMISTTEVHEDHVTLKIISIFNNNYFYINQIAYNRSEAYSDIERKAPVCRNMPILKRSEFFSNSYPESNSPIIFVENENSMFIGGFSDGKVIYVKMEETVKATVLHPVNFNIPVTAVSYYYNFNSFCLICGDIMGNITILEKDPSSDLFKIINTIDAHSKQISHIHYNKDIKCFVASSYDGFASLYRVPKCEVVNSYKISTEHINNTFISNCPVPCIVSFIAKKKQLVTIGINNRKVLHEFVEENPILSPIIVKDGNQFDYLIYISNFKDFSVMQLPELEKVLNIQTGIELFLVSFNLTTKTIIGYNDDGSRMAMVKWKK